MEFILDLHFHFTTKKGDIRIAYENLSGSILFKYQMYFWQYTGTCLCCQITWKMVQLLEVTVEET